MPILQTERKFKKIVLPSSKAGDEAWVEVWDKVLTSDVVAISGAALTMNEAAVKIIAGIIKDWNFTDKKGQKLPVTPENVQFLPIEDFAKIIEETQALKEIERLGTEKKKNSSFISAQKPTLSKVSKRTSRAHR